jgi:transcriptional regulator with XRE-family HTH domain
MPHEVILNLGKALRQKRKEKNLTIRQVSKEARISAGLLSLIENGITNPSIGTLLKIAEVIDAPIASFFSNSDSSQEIYVLRKNQRKSFRARNSAHYSYEYLAHDRNSNSIQPFLVTFDTEGGNKKPKLYKHKGEEFLYVIEGEVEFISEDKRILLKEGDSIRFLADSLHIFRSRGEKKAKCLTVVSNLEQGLNGRSSNRPEGQSATGLPVGE